MTTAIDPQQQAEPFSLDDLYDPLPVAEHRWRHLGRFIHPHCPLVELGLVGASMHHADEHVSLADLDSLTTIYTLMLEGFGRATSH